MEYARRTSANDESMVEVFYWIEEVEQKLRRIDAEEKYLSEERAQYVRTLRWLRSLDELVD